MCQTSFVFLFVCFYLFVCFCFCFFQNLVSAESVSRRLTKQRPDAYTICVDRERSFVRLSVCSFVRLSVCPFVRLCVSTFVRSFVCCNKHKKEKKTEPKRRQKDKRTRKFRRVKIGVC